MAKELPSDKASWNRLAKSEGIIRNTIHNFPKEGFRSASKIQIKQYLLLRVLWKTKMAFEFTAKDWLDLESYNAAKKYLEQHDVWKKYCTLVKELGMDRVTLPGRDIGAFTVVHHQQSQISQVERTYYKGCDTPKISIHTTNFSRSPEPSPLDRKSRAEQPAQAKRRYAARATAPRSSLDNPFLSKIPRPSKASPLEPKPRVQQPAQAKHRYPTRATVSRNSKNPQSTKASLLKPKSRAQQPVQAKRRYTTRATAPRSSLDSPLISEGPVEKTSQRLRNMTPNKGAASPSSLIHTPSFSTAPSSTRSSLEAISPMDAALVKAAKDEQIVNIALISFLHALTTCHEDVRAYWGIDRKLFHFSDLFEARTDGLLKIGREESPLAILEVKPHVRTTNIKQVQMQESAQMASWIYDHQNIGHISRSPTGSMRRVIISQDHQEIYVTFAEYDDAYIKYIRPNNQAELSQALAQSPFMTMHQFGPWPCSKSSLMKNLGPIILGLTIQQSREWADVLE